MTVAVERPDLSRRTALSKSALAVFDLCQTKAFYSIHDPRPFVPNEKVVFGSAVDAGVEVIIGYARMGQPPDMNRATDAAAFVIERDGVEVDIHDVQTALAGFAADVLPRYDWGLARTQASITAEIEGLGECNGHPDIILGNRAVWDVKTASRSKELPAVELGFYALLVEAETGQPVPEVGYFCWVRAKKPWWQIVSQPVTDELRRWAYERAASYVRAKKADAALNARLDQPVNFSFGGAPKFAALCTDCEYRPDIGGPCLIAIREDSNDHAA